MWLGVGFWSVVWVMYGLSGFSFVGLWWGDGEIEVVVVVDMICFWRLRRCVDLGF